MMNKMFPYVNMKIEKFSPRVKELRLKNKDGAYDSAGREHLNNKISRIESTLNEPAIKMVTDLFNKGIPFVPFPQIERCLGLGIKDAVVQIKDGYAIMGYDFKVQKSSNDCLFNMQETIKERELREIEKAKLNSGNPLDKVGSMVRMFQEQIAKQRAQAPTYDFGKLAEKFSKDRGELLQDMIKNSKNIVDNVQKFKTEFEQGNKAEAIKNIGDTLVKGIGQGLMDFF